MHREQHPEVSCLALESYKVNQGKIPQEMMGLGLMGIPM